MVWLVIVEFVEVCYYGVFVWGFLVFYEVLESGNGVWVVLVGFE